MSSASPASRSASARPPTSGQLGVAEERRGLAGQDQSVQGRPRLVRCQLSARVLRRSRTPPPGSRAAARCALERRDLARARAASTPAAGPRASSCRARSGWPAWHAVCAAATGVRHLLARPAELSRPLPPVDGRRGSATRQGAVGGDLEQVGERIVESGRGAHQVPRATVGLGLGRRAARPSPRGPAAGPGSGLLVDGRAHQWVLEPEDAAAGGDQARFLGLLAGLRRHSDAGTGRQHQPELVGVRGGGEEQ